MPTALPTAAAYRHAHEAHQRAAGGQVWLFDSLREGPQKIAWDHYVNIINKYPAAYPIIAV